MEKMAPNRGRKAVRESILKVAALAVLVSVFNCINGQELEGIMNERDQALLRETGKAFINRLLVFGFFYLATLTSCTKTRAIYSYVLMLF